MSYRASRFTRAVLQIDDDPITKGLVDALSGFVKYKVTYKALVFRPFKNEVLDAVVKTVSEVSAALAAARNAGSD